MAILITGGHGGIGLECSRELTKQFGCDLVLAGRSPTAMASVAAELTQATGRKVTLLEVDLSSLASVRKAAAECKRLLDDGSIDGLQGILCNAGGRFEEIDYSADGYERTFATNHLGHFLLVELLLDRVAPDGRIIYTASGTHDASTFDGKLVGAAVEPDAVALANTGKDGHPALSAGKRYTTSKLCNVMTAYELARRLQRSKSTITSVAFDPGSVPDSGFLRGLPSPLRWLFRSSFMKWVMKKMGTTTGDLKFSGASLARLAADPAYRGQTGKYFQSNDLRLHEPRSATVSYDEQRAAKLWNDSKQLAHLTPDEESPLLR